jgi:hypothetical protein
MSHLHGQDKCLYRVYAESVKSALPIRPINTVFATIVPAFATWQRESQNDLTTPAKMKSPFNEIFHEYS